MDDHSRSAYLETEVLTATPQRLRLMLIEAALRFACQTEEHWRQGRDQPGRQSLARCRSILAELLGTINADRSDVAARVRDLYAFLLRTVLETGQSQDLDQLGAMIRLLQIERETWRQVCHQMPEPPTGHGFGRLSEVTARGSVASLLAPDDTSAALRHAPGGFCLDA